MPIVAFNSVTDGDQQADKTTVFTQVAHCNHGYSLYR